MKLLLGALLLAGSLQAQSLEVGDEVVFSGGPAQPPQSVKTGSVVKFSNLRQSADPAAATGVESSTGALASPEAPEAPVEDLVAYDLGAAPLPRLTELLRTSPKPVDRFSALRALGTNPDRSGAGTLALEALADEDLRVVAEAARTLGALKEPRAVKPLVELLNQQDPKLLEAVIAALGNLGRPESIESIEPFADGSDGPLDRAARAALTQLRTR